MKYQFDFFRLFLLLGLFSVLSAQAADDLQNSTRAIEVKAANELLRLAEGRKLCRTQGGDPAANLRGIVERAYVARADGSVQPYLGYVPKNYDPAGKPVPLVVYLHGYVPGFTKANWHLPGGIPTTLYPHAERHGALLVGPYGRSNTDFLTIGEIDVLRVIEEMKRHYRVDPDRVLLAGISMGGSGVWTLLTHYPGRFAGGIILSGRTDYYFWHGLERKNLPAWKTWLIDVDNPIDFTDHLLGVPTFVYHGKIDPLVKVGHSQQMVKALKDAGGKPKYTEYPDVGHGAWGPAYDTAELWEWMFEQKLPKR